MSDLREIAESASSTTNLVESKTPKHPEQEPVAWWFRQGHETWFAEYLDGQDKTLDWKPLYTAPPNLQEMLKQAYLDGVNSGLAAIRAGSEK